MKKVLGIAALTAVAAMAPWLVSLDPTIGTSFRRIELLPWTLLLTATLLSVCVPLLRRKVDFSNPILFVALWYFVPFWGIGPVMFALGGPSDISIEHLPDPGLHFRLALVYVGIAIVALRIGFSGDLARRLGDRLGRRLPGTEWSDRLLVLWGLVLVAAGAMAFFVSFWRGNVGYQLPSPGDRFAALAYYLTMALWYGQALIWFAVFGAAKRRTIHYSSAALLITLTPVWMVLSGSRGIVVWQWLLLVLMFFLARGNPRPRNLAVLGLLGVICLASGFLYGTTFRLLKAGSISSEDVAAAPVVTQTDTTPSVDQAPQPQPAAETATDLRLRQAQRRVTLSEQVGFAAESTQMMLRPQIVQTLTGTFAARLDAISALAIIVGNRDRLTPESPFALRWGIPVGVTTMFIPRAVWSNKPIIGDFRSFGRLYFGIEANAFAVTPMGDLIINFGPLSVPAGMALLGMLLRWLQAFLVEQGTRDATLAALYAVCLLHISFEGFYGTILPGLVRVALIGLLCFAVPVTMSAFVKRRLIAVEAS